MRQMLLRVPDELHRRLTRAARDTGRSVNSLANEILDQAVPAEPMDERTRLREKARQLGVLVERQRTSAVDNDRWRRALASTEGIGPVLDKIFEDGR
ncbi:MAG TPA: toxin-antitoxin system HicB family antitoxin [Jiangellaceae bacterium]|jgi:plasmid stability protein